jgi:hypothetical protein
MAQAAGVGVVSPQPVSSPPAMAPTTPTALPPSLQALEQKTLQLQLNSERFSASESITGSGGTPSGPFGGFGLVRAHATSTSTLLNLTGEVSEIPPEASFQVDFLGLKSNGRLIGTTLYIEEPFLTHMDGGRPWVEEPNQHLEQATGVEAGTLEGSSGSGAVATFGKLVDELNEARSIQELGPMAIDGQSTTAFGASIELSKLHRFTGKQKGALGKLLEPLAHLEIFIAEDGLPVRTILTLNFRPHRGESAALIVQSDVLAVNVPIVAVQAPPADETISEARLKRLLKRKGRIVAMRRGGGVKSKQ